MKTPVLLPDVAAETDQRGVALHAVGIRGLRLPVLLRTPAETTQQVIAVADLSVDIDAQQRGAHMSRRSKPCTSGHRSRARPQR